MYFVYIMYTKIIKYNGSLLATRVYMHVYVRVLDITYRQSFARKFPVQPRRSRTKKLAMAGKWQQGLMSELGIDK